MSDHLFVLNPPRSQPWWSPWSCLCGHASGTGYDDDAAAWQYELHLRGLWPAFYAEIPDSRAVVVDRPHHGPETIWVRV